MCYWIYTNNESKNTWQTQKLKKINITALIYYKSGMFIWAYSRTIRRNNATFSCQLSSFIPFLLVMAQIVRKFLLLLLPGKMYHTMQNLEGLYFDVFFHFSIFFTIVSYYSVRVQFCIFEHEHLFALRVAIKRLNSKPSDATDLKQPWWTKYKIISKENTVPCRSLNYQPIPNSACNIL